MVSKKLREGEADEGEGPPAEGGGASKRKSKAVKKATVDSGLVSGSVLAQTNRFSPLEIVFTTCLCVSLCVFLACKALTMLLRNKTLVLISSSGFQVRIPIRHALRSKV